MPLINFTRPCDFIKKMKKHDLFLEVVYFYELWRLKHNIKIPNENKVVINIVFCSASFELHFL